MSSKLIQGQQGSKNTSSASKYVEVTTDYTLSNDVDTVFGVADCTVFLPPNPYPGQKHTVGAQSGATVTVEGGAFPLVDGPQTVDNQSARCYIFTNQEEWIEECEPKCECLVRTLFARVDEAIQVEGGQSLVFSDLISVQAVVTKGKKFHIWSSWSFDHTAQEGGAATHFRLAVLNPDTTLTILDKAAEATDVETLVATGAINDRYPLTVADDLAPGVYTVFLQWATNLGTAVIDPSANSNHATLTVFEIA